MTMPPLAQLAAVARDQGVVLSEARLRQAYETHRTMRPDLEKLRELPMPYLGDTMEPLSCLVWIMDGGRS